MDISSKKLVHGLDSSALEYGLETRSSPQGIEPEDSWSMQGEGGAFIDNPISLKEEVAGACILSVTATELDSLLCVDVKNLFCIEQ